MALLNLVINARDSMPDGGRITVELANAEVDETAKSFFGSVEQRPYALLRVSDTGVSMAPEVIEQA